MRLELQAEKGDTQIIYDGHTVSLYDAATNTLYRYTPPAAEPRRSEGPRPRTKSRRVAKIEEAISAPAQHADVSGATPSDVAGQPAYTVRVSPKEGGSLIGGAELSFDAVHGVPLRAAIYSSTSSSPVIELAASEHLLRPGRRLGVRLLPAAGREGQGSHASRTTGAATGRARRAAADKPTRHHPRPRHHGDRRARKQEQGRRRHERERPLEGLPKVTINGISASELRTALGTMLTFERSGVRYVLAGAVTPAAIEALARGLVA